jgi:peptide-methionine (S)-S-oxide reductase
MPIGPISDPLFRAAVAAIDSGDLPALDELLASHPELLRARADLEGGYFHRPFLLYFVAENPVRNGHLPANIATVTHRILQAAERAHVPELPRQRDETLGLVCSGRVARESGVQRELIDVLVQAGAHPEHGMLPALAHRETEATVHLLQLGAPVTLLVAACTDRRDVVRDRAASETSPTRQLAFTGAAFYGRTAVLEMLLGTGVEVSAYAPVGFHPHATAVHHAVDSGSLEAVRVLVNAGADLARRDRIYDGTPLDWAEHLHRTAIAAYLKDRDAGARA